MRLSSQNVSFAAFLIDRIVDSILEIKRLNREMTQTFLMELNDIQQPSQLFISSEKLSRIMAIFDPLNPESIEPIPVKAFRNQVVFTDGHTRAFAAKS